MSSKYEIQFWDDWHNADSLERFEKVKKLSFIKNVIEIVKNGKMSEDMKEHMVTTMLNSFFEDLENYLYQKLK